MGPIRLSVGLRKEVWLWATVHDQSPQMAKKATRIEPKPVSETHAWMRIERGEEFPALYWTTHVWKLIVAENKESLNSHVFFPSGFAMFADNL